MSPSHRRAMAHNFAEFAQNLEICTPKLEKLWLLQFFTFLFMFAHLLCDFSGIYGKVFLRTFVLRNILTGQENLLL